MFLSLACGLTGTQDHCKAVVMHLERIMRIKADMLNKSSEKRRVPKLVT
jgi:hypothetical protein